MDRAAYSQGWSRLHGGYDPGRSALVRGWLALTYALARPLARTGTSPHLLTAAGVAASALAAWAAGPSAGELVVAAGLVTLAAVLDGLDGAVAVLRDRATRRGFVLDSVADRVSDLLLLVVLWRAGAHPVLSVAAGAVAFLLEYTRARATVAGLPDIGVVTVGERPTRVVVVVAGLLSALAIGAGAVAASAAAVTGLATIGLAQLLVVAWRRLG